MEVYLIRHTTPAITKGMIYGQTDVGLTEAFSQEKDAILKQLPAGIGIVFSSPSTRCTRLAAHLSPAYRTDERLYELNFGQWEGQTWDTVDQQALSSWMQDYVHVGPPEGESMQQMQGRVMRFWQELLQLSPAKAAVVTHGGVIRIILAAIQGISLTSCFDLKVGYGEVFLVRPFLPE